MGLRYVHLIVKAVLAFEEKGYTGTAKLRVEHSDFFSYHHLTSNEISFVGKADAAVVGLQAYNYSSEPISILLPPSWLLSYSLFLLAVGYTL